jgi:hypothetical protein
MPLSKLVFVYHSLMRDFINFIPRMKMHGCDLHHFSHTGIAGCRFSGNRS